jgi:lipid-binding SYLF domain-containing protein
MSKSGITVLLSAILLAATSAWTADSTAAKADERLVQSGEVFRQIMDTPDKGIPQDLVERSLCIGIIPGVKKVAFVVGGSHGAGYVLCRRNSGRGPWGPPAAFSISGGSVGFQIGASETDLVLLFMNEDGMRSLLEDKFTLGADASVAAGPVGRSAEADTDAKMTAKVLSYSRSKGVFAGIALDGAVLKPSPEDNREIYGRSISARELLLDGHVAPPAGANSLLQTLDRYSAMQTKKPY